MATETGTYTTTATMTRTDVLIRQLNLVVQSTTGSTTFKAVIQKGIENKWIKKVKVHGLTKAGRIRQQIDMEIDWQEHELKISTPDIQALRINLAEPERNWVSRVIGQIIDGFNEITERGDLEAIWSVTYTPAAMAREAEVDRELGLKRAEDKEFEDGTIDCVIDQYRPKKLNELQITWKVITKR